MKNPFVKNKEKEIDEITEETEENTTPVEETEKKKTVPTVAKVIAAGAGVIIGAVGLSKLLGRGGEPVDWSDLDETDSEATEESTGSETEVESTEVSAESAE